MPTTTTQRAAGSKPRRTLKQLQALCKQMAMERGVAISLPRTEREAYGAISRLKELPRTSYAEVRAERHQIADDMATRRGDAAQVRPEETAGYGSSATWSRPELLATYDALDGNTYRIYGRRGEHGVRVMEHGPGPIRTASRTLIARDLHRLADLKVAVHGWLKTRAVDGQTAEVADFLVG